MVKTVSGFMYTLLEANQFKDSDWDQDIKKKKKNVDTGCKLSEWSDTSECITDTGLCSKTLQKTC